MKCLTGSIETMSKLKFFDGDPFTELDEDLVTKSYPLSLIVLVNPVRKFNVRGRVRLVPLFIKFSFQKTQNFFEERVSFPYLEHPNYVGSIVYKVFKSWSQFSPPLYHVSWSFSIGNGMLL